MIMFQSTYELEARIKNAKPKLGARRELMPMGSSRLPLAKLVSLRLKRLSK